MASAAISMSMASSPVKTLNYRSSSKKTPWNTRRPKFSVKAGLEQRTYAKGVEVSQGNGGLPKITLKSPTGSEAEIYLFGACVTSWKVPNGKDLLFVRPDAVFNGKKPISGGIPHCFPQFGPGPIQQHGFARNMNWSISEDPENSEGETTVKLELQDDSYSRAMWDFSFHALYKVTLGERNLSTTLTIRNTDAKPFSFSSALHTYFRASVTEAKVKGLKGCKTLNKDPDPQNPIEGTEVREIVDFLGFVDCVYLNAPNQLIFENGLGDTITVENTNWSDAVLWNPHLQMEACYKDFVCVENAQIGNVLVEPEQSWIAEQNIIFS
ncbi:hypothetical protein LUZ61_018041 [Rhynchospora tenuis]|uniref:glucose-6-phosphate 1-epimerase n=1 Tax=Rhynchospora tenuis TaxID=198213 RepID=A0AAD6ELJ7_9POAL|nr:hypothetical protein LUZ61_018041 [Rhynchospora tenuis]